MLESAGIIVGIIVGISMLFLTAYKLLSNLIEKKRQIKVELLIGYPPDQFVEVPVIHRNLRKGFEHVVSYDESKHRKSAPVMLLVSATNPGDRTATLTTASIITPNKIPVFFKDWANVPLPYDLAEGKNCVAWMEAAAIAKLLKWQEFSGKVKLIGCFTDAIGKTYRSKPLQFDVDKWVDVPVTL